MSLFTFLGNKSYVIHILGGIDIMSFMFLRNKPCLIHVFSVIACTNNSSGLWACKRGIVGVLLPQGESENVKFS